MKRFLILLFTMLFISTAYGADNSRNVDYSSMRIKEISTSAGMWQDFYSELRPFGRVTCYHNDFVSWVPDEWTITEVNASTQTLLDERNGILSLTPAGAENDGSNMQLGGTGDVETTGESWAPAAGTNLWFEVRVRSTTDADQNDLFVGLHVEDTAIIASKGSDYIGLRVDDGDANVDTEQTSASATPTVSTAVTTISDNVFAKMGFKVTSTDKIEFYVNDVLEATTTSNIPTALMKLSLAHLAGEATANVMDFDYVVVCQSR